MQGRKKIKESNESNEVTTEIPKKVLVHFTNSKGESLGVFEVPAEAGPQQFQ